MWSLHQYCLSFSVISINFVASNSRECFLSTVATKSEIMKSTQWEVLIVSVCFVCFFFYTDHLSFCISPNIELHCPRPLVCYLSPAYVQEHCQEGPQEHCCHLGCVVHHHDSSSHCNGVQQPSARAHEQDQPIHSVRWTLGRLVLTSLV